MLKSQRVFSLQGHHFANSFYLYVIAYYDALTDAGIQQFMVSCSGLLSIDLRGCYSLTDRTVEALARWKNLKRVNLADCPAITDRSLEGTDC